jgi:putative membrane protein
MRNLTDKYLSPQDLERIDKAVQAAEKETSGEIVCLIQSTSYHYPMANVIGATSLALVPALAATPLLGQWLWLGPHNMWLFLSIFAVCFPLFHFLVDRTAWLKRYFISQRELDEEVRESAITGFFEHALYRTREATGVLLLISIFERKVWVLADHGIHTKIPQEQWQSVVDRVTSGFRTRRPAESICEAVRIIGRQLQAHFPARPDDVNELKNVILDHD